jgi:hypothetical protein
MPPPPPLCFPPVRADYATFGGGAGGSTNTPFAAAPLPYTHTSGTPSAMTWAYIKADSQAGWTGYPAGWNVSSVKVCVSLYHSDGLSGVLTLQIVYQNGGPHHLNPLLSSRGGLATNLTDVCFEDSAAEMLPTSAAAEPFTGSWRPQADRLQALVDAGLGRVAGHVQLGVWVNPNYAWASEDPKGWLVDFSVALCFAPPPEVASPPDVPPSLPTPPAAPLPSSPPPPPPAHDGQCAHPTVPCHFSCCCE